MNRTLSVYLDLVRLLAAVLVLLTHLAYGRFSGGLLQPLRTYGNDGVMIFFVLSGFVIAHVAATRDHDVREYLLNRCARLFSVAVPAIVLTIVLDQAGRWLNAPFYDGFFYEDSQPWLRVLTAASFTHELWFSSWRLFSNGPYWSLGYEFWYYLLFAAGFYCRGWRRVALLTTGCLVTGPKILLLFPIWLLGVWVYRFSQRQALSPGAGLALFAASILGYVAFRAFGLRDAWLAWTHLQLGRPFVELSLRWSNEFISSYALGALVAANFIGFQAIAGHVAPLLARAAPFIRDWAGYTFSIYLFHYPLLQFLGATGLFDPTSPVAIFLLFLATLAGCRLVGIYTEQRKHVSRALLLRVLRGVRDLPRPA